MVVVVNEFGDVGVDGDILKLCVIFDCFVENIMEFVNGCICCIVVDDFIFMIEVLMVLEFCFDYILIEIFGLVLLKFLFKVFDWFDICLKIIVDGVIVLVDVEVVVDGCFVFNVVVVDV